MDGLTAMHPLALVLLAAPIVTAPLRQEGPRPIRHTAAAETRAGTPAPSFELLDIAGEPFELGRATEEGYVLLVFVRGMW